jgi:hypothetical protein
MPPRRAPCPLIGRAEHAMPGTLRAMNWLFVCTCLMAACGKPSGASAVDPDVEALISDTTAYDEKYDVIVVKFAGDCGAAADQLLTLEPLARSIHAHLAAIEGSPPRRRTLLERNMAARPGNSQRHDALLKRLGATEGDILHNEPAMLEGCANDPKFRDAKARASRSEKPPSL